MHNSVLVFGRQCVKLVDYAGKSVLEVGSYDVNGSIKPIIEQERPLSYLGVDMCTGPRVDQVVDAGELAATFGEGSFEHVISCEMLEHAENWKQALDNMKLVVKPGGHLLLTTRSLGFPYHGYPHDFWRFSVEQMNEIFADFEILVNRPDEEQAGVFVLARKPTDWKPVNLANITVDKAPSR